VRCDGPVAVARGSRVLGRESRCDHEAFLARHVMDCGQRSVGGAGGRLRGLVLAAEERLRRQQLRRELVRWREQRRSLERWKRRRWWVYERRLGARRERVGSGRWFGAPQSGAARSDKSQSTTVELELSTTRSREACGEACGLAKVTLTLVADRRTPRTRSARRATAAAPRVITCRREQPTNCRPERTSGTAGSS
jgi:hypothetical protein